MADTDTAVTIYHNPACGTSRNVLALIRQVGMDPLVIDYLSSPPSRETLLDLAARAGLTLRDIVRRKGTPYADLGLDDPSVDDARLLDAMMAHPILINRPLVAGSRGVRLCRPSDVVLDILPPPPVFRFLKEEGVPFLKDRLISSDDPGLRAALAAEDLPTDDLAAPGRTFFAYETLDGAGVGYGGLEPYGQDVLIRSVVVPAADRQSGIGRNLVPLLMFRAFETGARRAFLLTQTAVPFFAGIGFKMIDRGAAPPAILSTHQAASLCPASATLMVRKLGF